MALVDFMEAAVAGNGPKLIIGFGENESGKEISYGTDQQPRPRP